MLEADLIFEREMELREERERSHTKNPATRHSHVSSISARQSSVVSVHSVTSFQHCSHTPAHCCHPRDGKAHVTLKRTHAFLNVAQMSHTITATTWCLGSPTVHTVSLVALSR